MVHDTSLLNTQQYKVHIKGKVSNPRKGVVPSSTPRCSSYRKESLLVTNFTFYFIHGLCRNFNKLLKFIYFVLNFNRLIGLVGRVFVNGPRDLGSIPGRIIPKTLKKWYLIPPCLTLSNIRYISRVKWSNPGKGIPYTST